MVLLALVGSLGYHLRLDLAGVVAVETVTALLGREIRGTIEIGEIQNVTFEKIVARSVVIRDPDGNEVIRVDRVAVWPNFGALLEGTIYIDRVRVRGGLVTLRVSGTEDAPTVSIAETFLPMHPSEGPPDSNPLRVVIDGIVLDEIRVRGDVPGYEGLRFENVRAVGRVEVERGVLVRVFAGRAEMTGPYPGTSYIDRIVGRVDSDLSEGIEFFARGHRADDRFRARLRIWREEEEPMEMDLSVIFDPVRVATLAEMEVAPGLENLSGEIRGSARLSGPTDDLRLSGDLTSGAGRVHVRGELPSGGPITIHVWTEDTLRLEQLVPLAPAIRVGARARLEIETDDEGAQTRRLHVESQPFRFEEIQIPELTLDGLLDDEALEITALTTHVAGGHTRATGTVGFDGSLDVHVHAHIPEISREPNVRRFAPDARGTLDASLDIRADPNLENLRFDGRFTLRNARYGSVRAASLDARAHVSGLGAAPVLRVEGEASGLMVGELSLGEASVTIRGSDGGYELHAESADQRTHTRLTLDGRVTVHEDRLTLDTERLRVDLGDGDPWTGELDLTMRVGRSVTLDPLRLVRGDESIVVRGTYRFRGRDELDITLRNVDLDQLQRIAPETLEGIGGTLDAHLVIRGDVDTRPQGELTARIRDGELRGVQGINASVQATLSGDTLDTNLRVDLGDRGELRASGPVQISPAALRDPSRIMREADLSGLRVETEDLDLAPLVALAGSDTIITGRITTSVELAGTPSNPEIRNAVLVLDSIAPEGWDPLRAKLRLSYGAERLTVSEAWVADAGGELARGSADLPLALRDLPEDMRGLWRALNASTWSAHVVIAERRLDTWPRPLRDMMPPGIEIRGELRANGDENGPRATYTATARVVEMEAGGQCSAALEPFARLDGTLENGVADARISAFTGSDTPVVRATLLATLPLEAWIAEGEVLRFPATEITARVMNAPMSAIPFLCNYGSGPINGTLTAKDILTGHSVVGAVIDMPRLRVWERAGERGEAQLSQEFRVHVRAGSTRERDALTACVILGLAASEATPGSECREVDAARDGELISRVRVPVDWVAGQVLPEYTEDGRITSWNHFANVHVSPVLPFIPGIVAGDAVVNGHVEAAGPFDEMLMRGALDLSDGQLQIEGLGQHLHGISGRVELHGDEVVFPSDRPLTASDSDGRVTVLGRVGFEGIVPRTVDLSVSMASFPVRREGMVLAWLSGVATIGGTIDEHLTNTTVTTYGFSIQLPEQTAATLQPLEPHRELLVVGSQRVGDGPSSEVYEVAVHIDATDPFWVRRNDFAAQVSADLRASYRAPELRIEGRVEILRGTFEIFGKRFELSEGSITFHQGSTDLDPQVRVIAVYEIPGRNAATVTVEVTGPLTHPRVAFTSTETSDPAEIISLLVAGGRRHGGTASQAAEQQAASFLAGLTAGILTLGLRQEFGDVIPVLAIESQGFGGTRIRAGFTADDLIPDFLRDVIVGAYVEGFVTAAADGTNAAGSSSGSGGVGGGVTIEFTFPDDLLLRGTWVPVDNGSLDLIYEP